MWYSQVPQLTRIEVPVKNLPQSMKNYKILHLTDLHSARFGKGQKEIFSLLEGQQVDMVAITGDVVDRRKKDIQPGLELVKAASKYAPVYFVPGNHEEAIEIYGEFRKKLEEQGVNVLEKGKRVESKDFVIAGPGTSIKKYSEKVLIMLSHYPSIFKKAAENGVDLVLAGHTHGGQIRLPWIGALYAPGQGKFPEYDAGLFYEKGSYMYVNRGLGTSKMPVRFLCRPEAAVITLISW